jgi:hypothetical protein
MVTKGLPPLSWRWLRISPCAHLTVTSYMKLLFNRPYSRTVVTWNINENMALCIKLSVLTVFQTIIWIYVLYSEIFLLRDCSDCNENADPTSRVYAYPTVIQMIAEYHILWHYVTVQWHNIMTKNVYYLWIRSLLSRGCIRDRLNDCLAIVLPEFPFLGRKYINIIHENV